MQLVKQSRGLATGSHAITMCKGRTIRLGGTRGGHCQKNSCTRIMSGKKNHASHYQPKKKPCKAMRQMCIICELTDRKKKLVPLQSGKFKFLMTFFNQKISQSQN